MEQLPKLLIFASGSATGGGSGFENLVIATRAHALNAEIVGVVSNHEHGGVRERAERLQIPFIYINGPWSEEQYRFAVHVTKARWVALSGWLKLTVGLDPRTTFNIHPGPLPRFGGKGMHGHHVHEAVLAAYHRGEITNSAVSMHFVTAEYDQGPIFFHFAVPIETDDTPDTLGARVNQFEHQWQPTITNLVISGAISWDGRDPRSLRVPPNYRFHAT